MYLYEGAGVMYPEFSKVWNDLREIQANLIFSLLHMKRHPAMPRVHRGNKMYVSGYFVSVLFISMRWYLELNTGRREVKWL